MMNKIKLRALTAKDISITLKWNNDPEIKDVYSGHPFPVNFEMEQEWYEKILKSNIPITVFAIELIKDQKLIGLSILKNINLIHRQAEFAIIIGDKEERGKGYAKAATLKTLEFGFLQLGLHRIYLSVQKNNKPAIELYKKIGFSIEGEQRDALFKNGRYFNIYLMSILNREFNYNENEF